MDKYGYTKDPLKTDADAEKRLWAAVVERAVHDWLANYKYKDNNISYVKDWQENATNPTVVFYHVNKFIFEDEYFVEILSVLTDYPYDLKKKIIRYITEKAHTKERVRKFNNHITYKKPYVIRSNKY